MKNIKNYKINAYRLLYRFLKENGIFVNYLSNVCEARKIKGNGRDVLKNIVEKYTLDNKYAYENNCCNNIFNWAPSSFFWDASLEGTYMSKWSVFYQIHKFEYGFTS